MNVNIITGKPGSGRTKYIFESFSRTDDNLMITSDSSVYYIERQMSKNGIPGRCVGISSLANILEQEIGGITDELISDEMQIVIISDIMRINFDKLNVLKIISYNNDIVNNVSYFINDCMRHNISPEDLIRVANVMSNISYVKIKDIAFVYNEYIKTLKEKGFLNNVMFSRKLIEILKQTKLRYKNIFVDSLNKYDSVIIEMLEALIYGCENFTIAFTVVSNKSYTHKFYQGDSIAYSIFDEFVTSIDGCTVNRKRLTSNTSDASGISIIKNEFFNSDTNTESNFDDVFLHEASTIYKEIDFVASKIKELVSSGYSYDDIIITGTDIALYKSIIENKFIKSKINSFYYKSKKLSQTLFFDFLINIFDIIKNGYNVENIIKIVNIGYFDFSVDEINIINNFFLRFGKDLDIALKNGEIYDNDNFSYVKLIIDKVKSNIDFIGLKIKSCETFGDFISCIYDYLISINIQDVFEKQYKSINSEKPQLANEIIETWNTFVKVLDNINSIKCNEKCSIELFIEVFKKFCSEINILNIQEYYDEVKILDMREAQSRKSKICFVIGANEGKFPFIVSEGLVSDIEITQINNELKNDLEISSMKMIEMYKIIYSVLTLPSEKLFISWAKNDPESRPMRSATSINNILKIFSKNIIEEKDFYNNDKEEVFLSLLNNLSDYRKTGICSEEIDNLYWDLADDSNYADRLSTAVKNAVIDKSQFNSERVVDSYKEKKFFTVSRLEKFSQCPFKHYIEFALLPKYQKIFEESAANKGNFYHNIMNMFFIELNKNSIDIRALTFDKFNEIISPIIDKNISEHNENILESDITLSIEKDKMKRKIFKTAWNSILQLQAGSFYVLKTEAKFHLNVTLNNGENVVLIGRIDRIDEAEINGEKYIRIIDYKSGSTSFSEEKIRFGLQLELPIYMKGAIENKKPAGIYYSRIADAVNDIDSVSDNISKKYQLNGITIDNLDILKASDSVLDGSGSSDVIQADITLKGEVSKKSKVLSEQDFNLLIDSAENVAVSVIEKILNGETKAEPIKLSDFNSCDYCQYKAICHK